MRLASLRVIPPLAKRRAVPGLTTTLLRLPPRRALRALGLDVDVEPEKRLR